MLRYFRYRTKQLYKLVKTSLYQHTIGRFLIKHGLDEIQYSPILSINKYPYQKDPRIFTPYKTKGIILEIGTGNGENLVRIAKDNTNFTLLGFEISKEYALKTANRIMMSGCKNAKIIHGEAKQLIEKYIPNGSISKIYIVCPDPWPKKKHIKHRITYIENFIPLVKKLIKEGEIIVITDNDILAKTLDETIHHIEKQQLFNLSCKRKEYKELPSYIYKTKYIRKWEKMGKAFWYYLVTVN